METTFFSKEEGGDKDKNEIPELYRLAKDNINFSQNNGVGGWPRINNTTWTMSAMVAQTAGIPLSIPVDGNSFGNYKSFLPNIHTLTDVLKDNGYNQAVLFGSDASFGGRKSYYKGHGVDKFYDYNSAADDKIIPEDYFEWWGFEDSYLFGYAKQVLSEMASQDKPFSLTMLTADTHHVGGYRCSLCGDEYEENYDNVYACSSKQVYAFVEWIKQQDFYDNTTIIICGDHLSMDADYFERNVESTYERRVYNCIMNSSVNTNNSKNREFSPMDLFPTTLAAMGCEIEGDKLGLGVNLFSDKKTLCEMFGTDWLNTEIPKSSLMYNKFF